MLKYRRAWHLSPPRHRHRQLNNVCVVEVVSVSFLSYTLSSFTAKEVYGYLVKGVSVTFSFVFIVIRSLRTVA